MERLAETPRTNSTDTGSLAPLLLKGVFLSDTLPITNKIAAKFVERKWMRSAKAWRCFLEIPNEQNIPEVLTALIDHHVRATIAGDGIIVEISPAFIVDVPSRKKQFQVVIETVYEQQASLGPRLTALTDTAVTLTILPMEKQKTQPTPKPERDTIDERTIKGLHVSFFQNPKFQEWLSIQTAKTIGNPDDCKKTLKAWLQVSSCKEIRRDYFQVVLTKFNSWLNGGGIAQA